MTKQERNELIIKDYLAGMTRVELAVKYEMSDVGRILKESGIKFNKKGGNRPRYRLQKDIDWINKQIIALTKQGWGVPDIIKRYPSVNEKRVARVKEQAGILKGRQIDSKQAKNVSKYSAFNEGVIPYADNCDVKPKRYAEHFSQVIWR